MLDIVHVRIVGPCGAGKPYLFDRNYPRSALSGSYKRYIINKPVHLPIKYKKGDAANREEGEDVLDMPCEKCKT